MENHHFHPLQIAPLVVAVVAFGLVSGVSAQCGFSSGSTGADGAFNPISNITVPLPPEGILNYTTVNIPAGVTVRFARNANNTPVLMLASGDVTIAGGIDVSGSTGDAIAAGLGGPGGFDGGMGGLVGDGGRGLGPGGGAAGTPFIGAGRGGFGASYGGQQDGGTYGNARLVPLIGGSGGGGSAAGNGFGRGGGGGGGAILIASSGTLTLSGVLVSDGGLPQGSGQGSGGGIRVVANRIAGSGFFSVSTRECFGCGGFSNGRVRIEVCASGNTFTGSFPSSVTSIGEPSPVVVAALPTLEITAVGSVETPSDPSGSYTGAADVLLPLGTTTATVELKGHGLPLGTLVQVTVIPQNGVSTTVNSSPLAGAVANSSATANVPLTTGRSLIAAQATATISPSGGPLVVGSIGGEPIAGVRIAAAYGGASTLAYVSMSGREVPVRLD
jgi:hypothetical protein